MNEILRIEQLNVDYSVKKNTVHAVRELSLVLHEGEDLGIIGESGSGKSTIAASIMRSDVPTRAAHGRILYRGVDLLSLSEKEFDRYRWSEIAIVFQNSLDILNPVLPIGEQIAECVRKHRKADRASAGERVFEVLRQVNLPEATADMLPHQLSGGMRQRALIAMAISCRPRLLIADEPTSAVDEENKRDIVLLLLRLKQELGLTLLIVSHEIQTVAALTNRIAVLYGGALMEYGETRAVLRCARHIYTRGLLSSSPQINPYRDLWGLAEEGEIPDAGCPFFGRCPQRIESCKNQLPVPHPLSDDSNRLIACHCGGIVPLLTVRDISKRFLNGGNAVVACDHCRFEIYCGEVVSVIGRSGAGKSTLALICAGIESADSGQVLFGAEEVSGNTATSKKGGMQIIFQDPFSSVNGKLSVFKTISEPLRILKENSIEEHVFQLLKDVGLPQNQAFLDRPCSTLSGGQRQRVSIARALAMEPRLLIADEICSMLDPSTQANLLRMLKGIQQKRGMSILFITHDELLSKKIADRVFRIDDGKLKEIDDSLLV